MKIKAFTLIELVAVISIIGVLSGIMIYGISDWKDEAQQKKVIAYANNVKNKLAGSLISEWKMNEGSGEDIYDSGRLSNAFKIISASSVKWVEEGCPEGNSCLAADDFDSDYWDRIGTTKLIGASIGIKTICFWLKTTSVVDEIFVLGKGPANQDGDFILSLKAGVPKLKNDAEGHTETVLATKTVNDGNWHFICTTIKDSVTYFEIDGESAGSGNLGMTTFGESDFGTFFIFEQLFCDVISGDIAMDDLMMFGDSLAEETLISTDGGIDGVCGMAAKTYFGVTGFSGLDTFCAEGDVDVVPVFPTWGSSVSWNCQGVDGGESVSCFATAEKGSQATPPAPTLLSKTTTTVVLNTCIGCEYRRDGGAWQSSTTFSGLSSAVTYSFTQRLAETETLNASSESSVLSVTINKGSQATPPAPTLLSKTSSTVVLNTCTGCEYRRDGGTWQLSTTFNGLSPFTAYSFTQRLAATATLNASSESTALSVTTEKGSQATPSAPTLLSKTSSTVVLNTCTGCEYRRDGGTWQLSTTFNGLSPFTAYSFTQRLAATATLNASSESTALSVTTEWGCGSALIDSRDLQSYTTKQFGSACWMTKNLNYAGAGSTCYDGNSTYCTLYGRLYAYSVINTSCPSGWHLPTYTEWVTLNSLYGTGCLVNGSWNCNPAGTALKVGGVSGFDAVVGGYFVGSYNSAGVHGIYWGLPSYAEQFYSTYPTIALSYFTPDQAPSYYFSVRCVMNEQAATPSAPTLSSMVSSTVVLNTCTGCEYRRDGGTWQSSTTFSGLSPLTTYSFTQRVAASATVSASAESTALSVTTDTSQATPPAPTLLSKTTTTVVLNTCTGCEYRRDGGTWQSSTTFSGLSVASTHSFTQRLAETGILSASAESAALSVTTNSECGSFVDARDGQTYTAKQFGSACWMTKNLNYAGAGSTCYLGNTTYCTLYGRLYAYSVLNTSCPSGWHLPTYLEWIALNSLYGTSCSTIGVWNCSPAGTALQVGGGSGFDALLGGVFANSSYAQAGNYGYYWQSTGFQYFGSSLETILIQNIPSTTLSGYYGSIRCVQD